MEKVAGSCVCVCVCLFTPQSTIAYKTIPCYPYVLKGKYSSASDHLQDPSGGFVGGCWLETENCGVGYKFAGKQAVFSPEIIGGYIL